MAERVTLGGWTATCLRDTPFWVDAGACFHIVPRALWRQRVTPDDENRIPVALNVLLLQGHGRTLLLDAGIGERYDRTLQRHHRLDRSQTLLAALAAEGVAPEEVDTVVLSHLHFDHTGWLMRHDPADPDRSVPTFANARHIVQREEWDAARTDNPLARGSYRLDDVDPLMEAGLVDRVEGTAPVAPGVRTALTSAHAPGHQVLWVQDGAEVLFCPVEILPDTHHLRLAWAMAFDDMPVHVVEVKRSLLPTAAEAGWTVFLSHEMGPPFGRLHPDGPEAFRFEPIDA